MSGKRLVLVLVAFIAVYGVLVVRQSLTEPEEPPGPSGFCTTEPTQAQVAAGAVGNFGANLQTEGPLVDGRRASLAQARSHLPFEVPRPPVDARTGACTGIWVNDSGQMAFVWGSQLRMYVEEAGLSASQLTSEWEAKVRAEPGVWTLTDVGGAPAIGHDQEGRPGGGLVWSVPPLMLSLVSETQDLAELRAIAEDVRL